MVNHESRMLIDGKLVESEPKTVGRPATLLTKETR